MSWHRVLIGFGYSAAIIAGAAATIIALPMWLSELGRGTLALALFLLITFVGLGLMFSLAGS